MTLLHGEPLDRDLTTDLPSDPAAGRGPAWLDDCLGGRLGELVALRRAIHLRPETARTEYVTTETVRAALASAGIEAMTLPGGTGLVADIPGGPGPRIALRADLDALPITEQSGLPFASTAPGIAHACGHDVHTAVLVGAAWALAAAAELPGPVRLIFQPAEEVIPGGAPEVVAAGVLDGVAAAYALHCDPSLAVGRIATRVGPITSACDTIDLTVTGPGGHTSRPHLSVDVIGALAAVAGGLPALLTRRLPTQAGATLVWGMVEAGDADNVIPQQGSLRGTLRLADRGIWKGAEALVRELIAHLLAPYRAEFRITYRPGVPPTVNDADAVAAVQAGAAAAFGAGTVGQAPQSSGAEDFAIILDAVPGALIRLGVWDGVSAQVDLHSATFSADERAIPVGVRTLVHTVLAAQR